MDGFLIVDKPPFLTSHDVVDRVRRLFKQKKVGHTGTLDPMATGVLVLCLGKATRLGRFLQLEPKVYQAEITFGVETDTLDATGKIVREEKANLSQKTIAKVIPNFLGKVKQIPPMTSAIKRNGVPLYALARKGVEVERSEREVCFYQIEILDFHPGDRPRVILKVVSSGGAYIRVLASDLGKVVGTVAHLSGLRRLSCGEFSLEEAHTLEELRELKEKGKLEKVLLDPAECLRHCPEVILKKASVQRVRQGEQPNLTMIAHKPFNLPNDTLVRLADTDGNLVAMSRWWGERVFDYRRPVIKLEVVLAR